MNNQFNKKEQEVKQSYVFFSPKKMSRNWREKQNSINISSSGAVSITEDIKFKSKKDVLHN